MRYYRDQGPRLACGCDLRRSPRRIDFRGPLLHASPPEYAEAFTELLDEEERDHVTTVQLQQWASAERRPRWVLKTTLKGARHGEAPHGSVSNVFGEQGVPCSRRRSPSSLLTSASATNPYSTREVRARRARPGMTPTHQPLVLAGFCCRGEKSSSRRSPSYRCRRSSRRAVAVPRVARRGCTPAVPSARPAEVEEAVKWRTVREPRAAACRPASTANFNSASGSQLAVRFLVISSRAMRCGHRITSSLRPWLLGKWLKSRSPRAFWLRSGFHRVRWQRRAVVVPVAARFEFDARTGFGR